MQSFELFCETNPAFSSSAELQACLRAAKVDASDALADLLERYREYLLLIANAEVPDNLRAKLGASDLVQQSVAEAWQSFDRFEGTNEFELRGWLRSILLNNLRDANRKFCGTAKRNASLEFPLTREARDQPWFQSIVAADPSPSQTAVASEELTLLWAAVDRLPSHYAQVIRLRNLEYLTFAETAERMQLERDQTRKLWERAVQRLSKELKANP
jgi:RNA polymerase sigma-70 factor (ECF subfamily)